MATSWTQADLVALEGAIKKGVKTVQYQSGSVTYHSMDELLRLRDIMKNEIAGGGTVTRAVGGYDSGLGPSTPPSYTGGWWR